MRKILHNTLLLCLSFFLLKPCVGVAQTKNGNSDFKNWPKGTSPREIGIRVAEHFIATPHTNFNRATPPKVISYPESCTWYGALTFAKATADKALLEQLALRFEPLFGSRDTLIPKPDHVDYAVFGSVPLELYIQTGEEKYLSKTGIVVLL
jgi:unsaturated rhamnogalacturonyl hydrolase